MMKHVLFRSIVVGSLFFTSCGDKRTGDVDTGVNKNGLQANEAVDSWRNDLIEGRVVSLWDSLPKSYQEDVSGVVHSFGSTVDEGVYNEVMKTMSVASELLKDKRGLMMEMLKEYAPDSQREMVEKNYDSVVGLMNAITSSDAKDLDGLRKLDVAKFLGGVQAYSSKLTELIALTPGGQENMEKVKQVKATLLSESGDSAEVEVAAGDERQTMRLVKKEDRWLPENMVMGWPDMIDQANEGLKGISVMKPMQKIRVMAGLGMVQGVMKQLEGVNTKEEMMQKVKEVVGSFGGGI